MKERQGSSEKIPVEHIHPNSWNPFSMKPELFEALVRHIQNEGLLGQIVVRPCKCSEVKDPHFEIIDGENRWMAAQDRRIDLKEIDCLVAEKGDVEARLETINFNLEHGELIKEKFDSLVKELESRWKLSQGEIASRLFISKEELSLRLAPAQIRVDPPRIELQAKLPTFTISTRMHSRKEYEFVNGILREIMKEDECDESSAMIRVFEEWSGSRRKNDLQHEPSRSNF